jgi:hypothetical protein
MHLQLSVSNATICGLNYKSFMILIYDNDSGRYYKTTIMIVSYAPN